MIERNFGNHLKEKSGENLRFLIDFTFPRL